MATPISVAAVMGLVTYLTVFHLNLIISRLQAFVARPKQYLLDRMTQEKPKENGEKAPPGTAESTKDWPNMAKRFEIFPQKDKNPVPSNWWIVIFALYLGSQKILDLCKGGWRIVKGKFHRSAAEEKAAKTQRVSLQLLTKRLELTMDQNNDVEMGQASSTSAGVAARQGSERGVQVKLEIIEKS
jgi:hypothetical protein